MEGDPGLVTLHPGVCSSARALETCSLAPNTGCTAKQQLGALGACYLALLSLDFLECKKVKMYLPHRTILGIRKCMYRT